MSLTVVGLTGRARSGKDSVARVLVAYQDFHRVALADGVRSAFADLSGPTWDLHKELADDTVNVRRSLQLLGTEARAKAEAPRLWVDLLLLKVAYAAFIHPVSRRSFVVPDVRYDYEAEWLRDRIGAWGGRFECWRVERPGLAPIAESAHSSERLIERVRVDRVIVNDGPLSDLSSKVFGPGWPVAPRVAETEEELFDAIELAG